MTDVTPDKQIKNNKKKNVDTLPEEGNGLIINVEVPDMTVPHVEEEAATCALGKKNKFIDWKSIAEFFKEMKTFMIAETVEEAKYRIHIEKELIQQIKPALIFGGFVMAFVLGFFVVWGGLAPLDSAAIADGHIVVSGNHKTVQHLEGGVIDAILVADGDYVKEGQDLIILNKSHAMARFEITLSQLRFAKALEARLIAEDQNLNAVNFDYPILDIKDPEVRAIVKNQADIFELNKKALEMVYATLDYQIAQNQEKLKGLQSREESLKQRYVLSQKQLQASKELQSKGLETASKLRECQDRVAAMEGEVYSIRASIAEQHEAISEHALKKLRHETDVKQKIVEEYKKNRASVLELEQQLQAAQDVLNRIVIKAPNSGIVTNLQYHTVGGVIQQTGRIMDIVPQDDQLVAEVYVKPQDIESIYLGLETKIQLSAFKTRLVPRVDGKVTYVAADKTPVDPSMQAFRGPETYRVRVEFLPGALEKVNSEIVLYPGMPVTVFIVKGERTFLQYLLSPIMDSFHKAFKEA